MVNNAIVAPQARATEPSHLSAEGAQHVDEVNGKPTEPSIHDRELIAELCEAKKAYAAVLQTAIDWEARAEALEKELEEQIIESSESTRNWQKAEAEVAGLKARVARFLAAYDAVEASDVAEPWDRARSDRVNGEELAALAELRSIAQGEGEGS